MDKIKIAMIMNDFTLNGISMVTLNYCRHIDLSKFEITVITGEPAAHSNIVECERLGVSVRILPSRKQSSVAFYKALLKEISGKKYDIVHIHGNSAMISPELFIAFVKGVKVRIAHSHNSTCCNMKAHKLLLPFFNKLYTSGFACSSLAGKWLFGDRDFYVIPNGFSVDRFKYNENMRHHVRSQLGLEDKYIIGHVGRFNNQKNHPYLFKIFKKVAKRNPDAVLLIVGNGPDYDKIKNLADTHPYKERIIFYGETAAPEEIYNAIDVFVFPSKHEGLGIVLLEAQISGLPVITSNVVPEDVIISNRITFLPIDYKSIDLWTEKILESAASTNSRIECFATDYSHIKKYDISENARHLSELYIKLLKVIKK